MTSVSSSRAARRAARIEKRGLEGKHSEGVTRTNGIKRITKLYAVAVILFVCSTCHVPLEASVLEDLEVVAGRLRTEILSESVDQTQVREHLSSQSDNGSWPDIDYDDTSRTHWIPREHLRRILNLARSNRTEGGD